MPRSHSVIVCTYEQPRELDLVLCALARQRRAPDEVLVADDGSGAETAAVIETWRERLEIPLEHVWQRDDGYRKARIVNEAVRRSGGEHLIFLDGDSIPHRDWVGDHLQAATDNHVLTGRRVKLGPEVTARLGWADIESGRLDHPVRNLLRSRLAGDTKRLGLGVRLPRALTKVLHPRPRKLMGVNFSLPRAAFYAVNGYDEQWTVYGREDLDLELRLQRAGVPFAPLLNRAIVFHLFHPERERSAESLALAEQAQRSDAVRCTLGLEPLGRFDPSN